MHVNADKALQATAVAMALANNARYAAYKQILSTTMTMIMTIVTANAVVASSFLQRLCLCCAQYIADASFLLQRCTTNRIVAITRHIGEHSVLVIALWVCVLSLSYASILLCVSEYFVVVIFCSFTRT